MNDATSNHRALELPAMHDADIQFDVASALSQWRSHLSHVYTAFLRGEGNVTTEMIPPAMKMTQDGRKRTAKHIR